MKHYFLILLCGLALTFSSAYGQDSLVRITPSTARYFLEADDERWLLREKDSISNELINNLSTEIKLKNLIIKSFENDTLIYRAREQALKDNIKWLERDLDLAEREIKKQKTLKFIVIGLSILGIALL